MTRIYSGYIKSAYIYIWSVPSCNCGKIKILFMYHLKFSHYFTSEPFYILLNMYAMISVFPHLFSACTLTCPVNSLLPQVHGTIGTMELGETKPASGCVRGRFQIHLGYIPKTGSWRSWYGFLVPFQAGFTSSPKYFSVYWVNRLVKGLVHGFKSKEPCFIWS